MLSINEKTALQNEFNTLVSANLKKDGAPKKKADPLALARIVEIRKLAQEQNEYEVMLRRIRDEEKAIAFIQACGFRVGQEVKFKNPLASGFEKGKITACALLPCPPQVGQIGVSIDESIPYMFRPEELTIA